MDTEKVKKFLSQFDAETDDLELLEEYIDEIWENEQEESFIETLFEVFENNSKHDGYGIFWTILHGIETIPNFEKYVLSSISKQVSDFSLIMAIRILNPKSVTSYKKEMKSTLLKVYEDSSLDEYFKLKIKKIIETNP